MRTLEIEEITEEYKKKRLELEKELETEKFETIKQLYHYKIWMCTYHRIFRMKVELKGKIIDIEFGFVSCDSNGPRISSPLTDELFFCEPIEIRIKTFCRVHRHQILIGENIVDIVESDKDNILKYVGRNINDFDLNETNSTIGGVEKSLFVMPQDKIKKLSYNNLNNKN